jgi:F0F1-type ATP synthase assembly protein I
MHRAPGTDTVLSVKARTKCALDIAAALIAGLALGVGIGSAVVGALFATEPFRDRMWWVIGATAVGLIGGALEGVRRCAASNGKA